jgi:nucleoside 2-deoxyribosyltransferase
MLAIVGGVYRERCMRPNWDEFYGSAGRAASAIARLGGRATLHCYLTPLSKGIMDDRKSAEGFEVSEMVTSTGIEFYYEHGLARPQFQYPETQLPSLAVQGDNVLRYGMLESTAVVTADYAVFDPQNLDAPESFHRNGSTSNHLALVLNRYEARSLLGNWDAIPLHEVARNLADKEGAEVVIIKSGPQGALVWDKGEAVWVPAYETANVWKIGSGDQFAANFAYAWMEQRLNPVEAAERASRATAFYSEYLGFPTAEELDLFEPDPVLVSEQFSTGQRRNVYLAGPFFTLGQLWVVEQARRNLLDMGLNVFSPYHDVGPGDAADVVPKDIEGIRECDLMLAILDGTDAGTVFEVGFAHRDGKPVVVYAENETSENCKMMDGSGCFIRTDFVSALYKTVWVAASL